MSAWVFQHAEDVRTKGSEGASWYAGWYDRGKRRKKSFGPGFLGRKKAEKWAAKVELEMDAGTYQQSPKVTWAEFRGRYTTSILESLAAATQAEIGLSMDHFERISNPHKMSAIDTETIDRYAANRRKERGKKHGSTVSPATVNKELRHLKAVLRVAVDWGYLPKPPKFRMEKEPKKLATYVTGDDFAAIYAACDLATEPQLPNIDPADWWRGLLSLGYMTGWRLGDMLGLRRDDLDLEGGYAITRADASKGKRDDKVKLHPVVVDHLRKLAGFTPLVFPWRSSRRRLYEAFARLQTTAGIHLDCHGNHTHTPACHVYGFHDLRRAFATMNADKLTADALQSLMRHKSYQTTQRYINLSRQMDAVIESLHVPDCLRAKES